MSQENLDELLNLAVQCAKEAGKLIVSAINKEKKIQTKTSSTDLVTETDKACEELIVTKIKDLYPDHDIIGEESTVLNSKVHLTSRPTWIIDPIDGTTNFVHGFPYVAVCIGFSIKQKVKLGVVYNPILNRLYYAKEGGGAFLNSQRIEASQCTDLTKSLLISEWGSNRKPERLKKVQENFNNFLTCPCHGIRSTGSAALNMCLIAEGRADGNYEFGIHVWDYAASSIIVEEANGVVLDVTSGSVDLLARRVVAAGTKKIALEICANLVEIQDERD
ncbi:hypothetical protein Zmor_003899 [Zophobas morio]|jgi:myo-inositol-1(or 4)-monophosphatase|uniref:Inositol-1-monophosphatase n=1 Tax=Zophobas morio TaxID=2755281 RepID=A0AA38HJ74_9CUCU|nr:hypothetical protein Zmor_003899 [Zophobas morio]